MEVIAKGKFIRIAPRKVRLVGSLIRGLPVAEALGTLHHLPKRSAEPMEKILRSAIANARHNFSLEDKNLRVKNVIVDGGPVLKRTQPRAFGRAFLIRKRTSHITLTLDELVASTRKSETRKKVLAPEVRKATLEELSEIERENEGALSKSAGERKTHVHSEKNPGFVRRIFNRKAV